MINTITLEGNLTSDPELRFTPSGKAVCKIRIAHTPRQLDRTTNEWSDGVSTFMNVDCWDKLAENVTESLRKGDKVIVTGRLETENYTTSAGEERSVLKVRADGIAPSLARYPATIARSTASAAAPQPAASDAPW